MKTIVLYYSFKGSTKAEAEKVAETENAVLCRVEEIKKRNLFTAFFPGCPDAMKRKAVPIKPIGYELEEFDRIIIGSPIWGGFPVPAFNAIAQKLPPGKDVGLFFCSAGGSTPNSEEGTKEMIAARGCNLSEYRVLKTEKKR